jgi:hypothetical protein
MIHYLMRVILSPLYLLRLIKIFLVAYEMLLQLSYSSSLEKEYHPHHILLPLLCHSTSPPLHPLPISPSSLLCYFAHPPISPFQVFGSHEDDLLMTEGASGVREQITVGFLELADDLAQRLPVRTHHLLVTTSFKHISLLIENSLILLYIF